MSKFYHSSHQALPAFLPPRVAVMRIPVVVAKHEFRNIVAGQGESGGGEAGGGGGGEGGGNA